MKHRLRHAFTLLELLSVIAIFALLAAFLFPAGKRIMDKAAATKCVSNLKQLGVATKLFAADNNEEIPYATYYNEVQTRWHHKLVPYLQVQLAANDELPTGPFRCPSSTSKASGSSRSHYSKNFYINGQLGGPSQNPRTLNHRFPSMPESSKYYYLGDGAPNAAGYAGRELGGSGITDASIQAKRGFQARHQGRANVLFLDFHVESLALEEIPESLNFGQPPWCPRE